MNYNDGLWSFAVGHGLILGKRHLNWLPQNQEPKDYGDIWEVLGSLIQQLEGLNHRLSFAKGPDYIWHGDPYDKLKPYGWRLVAVLDQTDAGQMLATTIIPNTNAGYN